VENRKSTMTALNSKILLSVLLLSGVFCQTMAAENWLYRTPLTPTPSEEDQAKDCTELEHEIRDLSPLTYSYKPVFYDDPYQGAAVLAGATVAAPALIVPVYSAYVETQERKRIYSARERISVLRQLKAEKRCFVD
jgi:hypothetical protein